MNAPHRPSAPPEAWIKSYVPQSDGEDLALRLHLFRARDHITALLGNAVCEMGHQHLRDAHDLAGHMMFKHGASETQLKAAVDYCRALTKAAMCAEILDGAVG